MFSFSLSFRSFSLSLSSSHNIIFVLTLDCFWIHRNSVNLGQLTNFQPLGFSGYEGCFRSLHVSSTVSVAQWQIQLSQCLCTERNSWQSFLFFYWNLLIIIHSCARRQRFSSIFTRAWGDDFDNIDFHYVINNEHTSYYCRVAIHYSLEGVKAPPSDGPPAESRGWIHCCKDSASLT